MSPVPPNPTPPARTMHFAPTVGDYALCGERFGSMSTTPRGVTCEACLRAYANPAVITSDRVSAEETVSAEGASRQATLEKALSLVTGQRAQQWGSAQPSFDRIAAGWEQIFGVKLTGHQVALAMAWLKISRAVGKPEEIDSYVDIAGYAALASELEK